MPVLLWAPLGWPLMAKEYVEDRIWITELRNSTLSAPRLESLKSRVVSRLGVSKNLLRERAADHPRVRVLEVGGALNLETLTTVINEDPDVLAERIPILHVIAATPGDPLFPNKYEHKEAIMNSVSAWEEFGFGQTPIAVGIADTGVQLTHPDLAANIIGSTNLLSPGSPVPQNEFHGTHVSGIVAAPINGTGVVGVHPEGKLYSFRLCNSAGQCFPDYLATALSHVKNHNANPANVPIRVINASLGGFGKCPTALKNIIKAYPEILLVFAAGNDGSNNDVTPYLLPDCAQPNQISVASTNGADQLSSFSNYGATTVEVAAPGQSILSTDIGSQYAYANGTSMATPQVSGLAAYILSINPELSAAQVREIVLATVDTVPALAGKLVTSGRVSVYRAIQRAFETLEPEFSLSVSPATVPETGGTVTFTIDSKGFLSTAASLNPGVGNAMSVTFSSAKSASIPFTYGAHSPGTILLATLMVPDFEPVSVEILVTDVEEPPPPVEETTSELPSIPSSTPVKENPSIDAAPTEENPILLRANGWEEKEGAIRYELILHPSIEGKVKQLYLAIDNGTTDANEFIFRPSPNVVTLDPKLMAQQMSVAYLYPREYRTVAYADMGESTLGSNVVIVDLATASVSITEALSELSYSGGCAVSYGSTVGESAFFALLLLVLFGIRALPARLRIR